MKVEEATLKDVFDYFFDLGAENYLSEKERNIYTNYLKNGVQSFLKLVKTLMMDVKIMLEMKVYKI